MYATYMILKVSSNINEVTRAILNFYSKTSQQQKNTKRKQANKNKKKLLKTSKGKIVTYSLICVLCFCPICRLVLLVLFVFLVFLVC